VARAYKITKGGIKLDLEKVKKIEAEFFAKNYKDGFKETDQGLNNISRAYIRAMKSKYGKCFIGYRRSKGYGLKEYRRGLVGNFGCDFVVPEYDEILNSMILNDNTSLQAIHNRIKLLEGVILAWV
jgi:hypothetical protein